MTLTFTKPHRLSQLHDEIIAAYPSLKEVLTVEGKVGGQAESIRLALHDGVEDPGLAAVVAAHVPDFTPKLNPGLTRLSSWVQDPNKPEPTRQVVLDLLRLVKRDLVG